MVRVMKRQRAQSLTQLDQPMIEHIMIIKSDHPLWGYRRIWAYLRYREDIIIGKNRVYRLMKENHLLVSKNTRLKAKRGSLRSKPRAKVPNQFWGTDMTKVKIQGWGWAYVHIVLDWYTKEIIGHHTSFTSKTNDWLDALNQAVNTRFPKGILSKKGKPKLISDNGCQPTSERFMKTCSELKIKQIFTTFNNPKGNADTERVFRTMKEDCVWIHEWKDPFQFQLDLETWIQRYNTDFPHQSLGYKTPDQFMKAFCSRKLREGVVV